MGPNCPDLLFVYHQGAQMVMCPSSSKGGWVVNECYQSCIQQLRAFVEGFFFFFIYFFVCVWQPSNRSDAHMARQHSQKVEKRFAPAWVVAPLNVYLSQTCSSLLPCVWTRPFDPAILSIFNTLVGLNCMSAPEGFLLTCRQDVGRFKSCLRWGHHVILHMLVWM